MEACYLGFGVSLQIFFLVYTESNCAYLAREIKYVPTTFFSESFKIWSKENATTFPGGESKKKKKESSFLSVKKGITYRKHLRCIHNFLDWTVTSWVFLTLYFKTNYQWLHFHIYLALSEVIQGKWSCTNCRKDSSTFKLIWDKILMRKVGEDQ